MVISGSRSVGLIGPTYERLKTFRAQEERKMRIEIDKRMEQLNAEFDDLIYRAIVLEGASKASVAREMGIVGTARIYESLERAKVHLEDTGLLFGNIDPNKPWWYQHLRISGDGIDVDWPGYKFSNTDKTPFHLKGHAALDPQAKEYLDLDVWLGAPAADLEPHGLDWTRTYDVLADETHPERGGKYGSPIIDYLDEYWRVMR